ncbi:MAG TPA: AAA family ATPase [Saprospiraceae bacterium]|nr:AAA family ATPase [Saprospiraceae bacterium]MCB9328224.1 AAA family ATPase [Lewinellaceae bacterium]HPK09110.1 AAA family ATPase [Saprospiraceae bacterium]HPQ22412.1 AAA family ATPase [Saprospiraceae bacterium]
MNKAPMTLSNEFIEVLNALENTHRSYFVTGRAGTGKSTLLQIFRETSKKRVAVVAPTGIAALNVRGQTIHSFFGFPPRIMQESEIFPRKNKRMYQLLDTLVIDEISMVRADVLDNIDKFLRINRKSDKPFGGVQLIMFGDLFQLPPVVSTTFEKQYFNTVYKSPYFFSSHVLKPDIFYYEMINLHHVYRQDERHFINLLDSIRLNNIDFDEIQELNERYTEPPEDTRYLVTLTSINATANSINLNKLNALPEEKYLFQARIDGNFENRNFPTELILQLKKGAQVMFVKNDGQKRFVNGTIGIISDINSNSIKVLIEDTNGMETEIEVEQQDWEMIKYDYVNNEIKPVVTGVFTQYPLKLAWAMTIHKSQGKTFDRIYIDLGRGAFEHGQTYVALSRCRTLGGIYLAQPLKPRDILVDERIREYYYQMR